MTIENFVTPEDMALYVASQAIGSGGIASHGALIDLDIDDHTHYLLADGTRIITYLQLDTSFSDGSVEGRLQWNIEDGTLEYGLPGGNVTLQVGLEQLVKCVNKTGVTITDGAVVYISGASGSRPEISLADASDTAQDMPIGMATENIANNANGYVTVHGYVRDIDTSVISVGAPGYLSETTPGVLRATAPGAGNAEVIIGICIFSNASSGIFLVDVEDQFSGHLVLDGSRPMTGNLDMGTNAITNVGNVDGRDVSADGSKLDGIESGATQDQSNAEIMAAVQAAPDGAGSGLDADLLDGVHRDQLLRSDVDDTLTATLSVDEGGGITIKNVDGQLIESTGAITTNLRILQDTAGTDAFMTFHVSGDFAANFGIDGSTNQLSYGGWSAGAASNTVWHAGNDGTGSGLDADLLDAMQPAIVSTANTIAQRDASADVKIRLLRQTYATANGNGDYFLTQNQIGDTSDNFARLVTKANVKVKLDLTGTNSGDEPDATTSVKGIIELATQAEVDAETDTVRAVTPATLGAWPGGGATPAFENELLHVRDQKTSGTVGGTFTAGAWRTRTLNTVLTNEITSASLSSNQISLPAGTYYVEATAPVFFVTHHVMKLRDITNTADLIIGISNPAGGTSSVSSSPATLKGRFTLAGTTTIELQHRCTTTRAGDGLGDPASYGVVEVYSDVTIWKVG